MPSSARLPSLRAAEATAPCRLDLAGGVVAGFEASLWPSAAVTVAVALDRRAQCRVEALSSGLRVESKDTLLKIEVEGVHDLPADGVGGLVRRVLLALGAASGLHVVTQARVPTGAGLASDSALTLAVAAAASRVLDRAVSPLEWPGFVRGLGGLEAGLDVAASVSVSGGAGMAPLSGEEHRPAERLRADPARIEECLLLVDAGATSDPAPLVRRDAGAKAVLAEISSVALRVGEALATGAWSSVAGLVAAEYEAWKRLGLVAGHGAVEAIARLAGAAGGAARPCGVGAQSLVLVWAEPGERRDGPREAVAKALKDAGYRTFPGRVDLRGLEVEEA